MCRAKKRAYQQATEDAFSKVLLVTLSGGKVHVEVNTTVEERLHHSEGLDLDAMLTVRTKPCFLQWLIYMFPMCREYIWSGLTEKFCFW